MKRTIAGVILAPLIWPFIEGYIAGVLYMLFTGTTIELSWNAGFHNLHRYWWGYGLMAICGIPLIIMYKKYHFNKLWHFILGAGLLALIVPVIVWAGGAIIFEPQHVTLDALVDLVVSGSHLLLSSSFTFMFVITLFWFIAIKNNTWYVN